MKGEYVYKCDGKVVDIIETFEIDGNHLRSERRAFGTDLRVVAFRENDSVTRFQVDYGENVSAKYQIQEGGILVEHVRNGKMSVERRQIEGRFEAFPLMRVFMGKVIRQIEALGGQDIQIVVPWVFDPTDEKFLSIHVDRRSAKQLEGDLYQYIGENYDEAAKFWIDARGILTGYEWKQGGRLWDVKLLEIGN